MDILEFLYQRMWQLEGRVIEITNYVKRDGKSISKKDFTLTDIPKIKKQVGECSAAIEAIKLYRRGIRKLNKEQKDKRSVATEVK